MNKNQTDEEWRFLSSGVDKSKELASRYQTGGEWELAVNGFESEGK